MQIQFLGTSSGVPTRQRSLSALALRADGRRDWLLVDCGEGTQHRLLHSPLSLATLAGICITHRHGDHCLGLPGLLGTASMDGRQTPLTLVCPQEVRRFVSEALALTDSQLGFALEFVDVATPGGRLPSLAGFTIDASALSHRVPSFGYGFTEPPPPRKLDTARLAAAGIARGPLWGRLQKGEDVALPDGRTLRAEDVLRPAGAARRAVIGGDNDTPALLAEACRGAQLLVHEATYTAEVAARVGPAPMHSDAQRVARFAAAAGIPNLILTHFSPRYGAAPHRPNIDQLATEARAHYDGRLFLAQDLAIYRLDEDGTLQQAPSAEPSPTPPTALS